MYGRLHQLNVSRGGMPKLPIAEARVTLEGVEGDWQKNRKYHGGRDRAICLFSTEQYDQLRLAGIDLKPGSVGENFTTSGFDLQTLGPGSQLRVGPCVIEITAVRVPCRSLNQWDPRLLKVISGNSGWVAKVLQEGDVKAGDAIEVVTSPAGA